MRSQWTPSAYLLVSMVGATSQACSTSMAHGLYPPTKSALKEHAGRTSKGLRFATPAPQAAGGQYHTNYRAILESSCSNYPSVLIPESLKRKRGLAKPSGKKRLGAGRADLLPDHNKVSMSSVDLVLAGVSMKGGTTQQVFYVTSNTESTEESKRLAALETHHVQPSPAPS